MTKKESADDLQQFSWIGQPYDQTEEVLMIPKTFKTLPFPYFVGDRVRVRKDALQAKIPLDGTGEILEVLENDTEELTSSYRVRLSSNQCIICLPKELEIDITSPLLSYQLLNHYSKRGF